MGALARRTNVRRCLSSRFLLCSNFRAYSWLIFSSWSPTSSSLSSNKFFFAILAAGSMFAGLNKIDQWETQTLLNFSPQRPTGPGEFLVENFLGLAADKITTLKALHWTHALITGNTVLQRLVVSKPYLATSIYPGISLKSLMVWFYSTEKSPVAV